MGSAIRRNRHFRSLACTLIAVQCNYNNVYEVDAWCRLMHVHADALHIIISSSRPLMCYYRLLCATRFHADLISLANCIWNHQREWELRVRKVKWTNFPNMYSLFYNVNLCHFHETERQIDGKKDDEAGENAYADTRASRCHTFFFRSIIGVAKIIMHEEWWWRCEWNW